MINCAPQIVEWDDLNKKEVEEAKLIYQKARRENRQIETINGEPIEFFKPSLLGFRICGQRLAENQFSFRILNDKGDETVVWDSTVKEEVEEARKLFDEYSSKGWRAYAIGINGLRRRIRSFLAQAEEIEFDEGPKEKLKNFVSSFKEIKMLPKTYPG